MDTPTILLIVFVALQCADAALTLWIVDQGGSCNFLLTYLMRTIGKFPALMLTKLVVVIIMGLLYKFNAYAFHALIAANVFYLFVVAWNVRTVWVIKHG